MSLRSSMALVALSLSACAVSPAGPPDFAAKNRPLEERCVRVQPGRSVSRPDMTHAEVQREAQNAARRGELDKACDVL